MAETAIARREARRRKILENSHNRLQLISGKNDNDLCKEPSIALPIPRESYENSIPKENSINKCLLNNGVINVAEEPFHFLSTNHESFALGDGDVTVSSHDTAALIPPNSATATPGADSTQVSTQLWETLNNYKYDIVLLSLFIQLLYCFSLVTYNGTYFFVPLFLYFVTKQCWFPKQQNSNIANVLLLLNGMSPGRAQKFISITQYISAFSQDVCVYLFTTICLQSLVQTIGVFL